MQTEITWWRNRRSDVVQRPFTWPFQDISVGNGQV